MYTLESTGPRRFLLLCASVPGLVLAGCISPPRWTDTPPSPSLTWIHRAQPRTVAVLVHGMNNTPEAMIGIAELLTAHGCAVASVRLAGHDPVSNRRHGATRERWIAEVGHAVERARAEYPGVAVIGVGYSLGAALLTAWVDRGEEIDGLVLLAPGIRIHPAVNLIRSIAGLAGSGLCLPSFTPREYRAFRLTSLDTYRALFDVVDGLAELERPGHVGDTPALVLADRNDELVDIEAFANWTRRHSLTRWVLRDLRTNPWHHVMLDRESMGESAWRAAENHLAEFLAREGAPDETTMPREPRRPDFRSDARLEVDPAAPGL